MVSRVLRDVTSQQQGVLGSQRQRVRDGRKLKPGRRGDEYHKRVFWYRTRILKARVSSPIWKGGKKKLNLSAMNPNEMARGTSNERVEESGTGLVQCS